MFTVNTIKHTQQSYIYIYIITKCIPKQGNKQDSHRYHNRTKTKRAYLHTYHSTHEDQKRRWKKQDENKQNQVYTTYNIRYKRKRRGSFLARKPAWHNRCDASFAGDDVITSSHKTATTERNQYTTLVGTSPGETCWWPVDLPTYISQASEASQFSPPQPRGPLPKKKKGIPPSTIVYTINSGKIQ